MLIQPMRPSDLGQVEPARDLLQGGCRVCVRAVCALSMSVRQVHPTWDVLQGGCMGERFGSAQCRTVPVTWSQRAVAVMHSTRGVCAAARGTLAWPGAGQQGRGTGVRWSRRQLLLMCVRPVCPQTPTGGPRTWRSSAPRHLWWCVGQQGVQQGDDGSAAKKEKRKPARGVAARGGGLSGRQAVFAVWPRRRVESYRGAGLRPQPGRLPNPRLHTTLVALRDSPPWNTCCTRVLGAGGALQPVPRLHGGLRAVPHICS